MTQTAGREPVPELTTTRTGGGRSARFIALGVSVVLVVVVYLGVTGQKPSAATSDASTKPAAANPVTSPLPSATPAYPGPTVATGNDPPRPYFLGVGLTVGGETAIAMLNQGVAHELYAAFTLPTPVPDGDGTLDLRYVDNRAREQSQFATWSVPLSVFRSSEPSSVVFVDDTRPPDPIALIDSTSQPVDAIGYRLVATGVTDASSSSLGVNLTVASDPTWPDESYRVVATAAGHQIDSTGMVIRPGRMVGEIVVDSIVPAGKIVVEISALPSSNPHGKELFVARYVIPAADQYAPPLGTPFIDDVEPARGPGTGVPGVVANGYHCQLFLSTRGTSLVVTYQLVVNPTYDPAMFGSSGPSR